MKTIIVAILMVLTCFYGYVANIAKLARCDFASPYKAEVFRTVGIFFPPMGVVEGFISIKD